MESLLVWVLKSLYLCFILIRIEYFNFILIWKMCKAQVCFSKASSRREISGKWLSASEACYPQSTVYSLVHNGLLLLSLLCYCKEEYAICSLHQYPHLQIPITINWKFSTMKPLNTYRVRSVLAIIHWIIRHDGYLHGIDIVLYIVGCLGKCA